MEVSTSIPGVLSQEQLTCARAVLCEIWVTCKATSNTTTNKVTQNEAQGWHCPTVMKNSNI